MVAISDIGSKIPVWTILLIITSMLQRLQTRFLLLVLSP